MLVKDSAQRAAADVLNAHWDDSFPVDPVAIAAKLGIEVKSATFHDEDTSGAIIASSAENIVIYLAENQPLERQTFTCAHELGHYAERMAANDEEYSFVEVRSPSYDLHEFFADEFAGNLLMPKKRFLELWESEGSVSTLAEYFAVSYSAAAHRLKRLKREVTLEE